MVVPAVSFNSSFPRATLVAPWLAAGSLQEIEQDFHEVSGLSLTCLTPHPLRISLREGCGSGMHMAVRDDNSLLT